MSTIQGKIGLELEFPLVNKTDGTAINHETIQKIWQLFLLEKAWTQITENSGVITGIQRTIDDYTEVINTDRSIATIEFSLKPCHTVQEAIAHARPLLHKLVTICDTLDVAVLSLGAQPISWFDTSLQTPKDWYTILNQRLKHWEYALPSAAHQYAIDVTLEEWIPVVNTLSALSGLLVALQVSSPVTEGTLQTHKEMRGKLWRDWASMHDDPDIGRYANNQMPEQPFTDIDDYLRFFWDSTVFYITNGKYAGFGLDPAMSFIDYIKQTTPVSAYGLEGKTTITPQNSDLQSIPLYGWLAAKLHYTIKPEATLQAAITAYDTNTLHDFIATYGKRFYVEYRPIGQPAKEEMAAMPACVLGLIENLQEAKTLVTSYTWEEWKQVRIDAEKNGLDFAQHKEKNRSLIQQILDIAQKGLHDRGQKEELLLTPLYNRLHSGITHADEIMTSFSAGGVAAVITNHHYKKEDLI